jgi:predicted dehydrogenase
VSASFEIPGFTDFEKAIAQKPAVMTISTPPALHEQYVLQAMDRQMHVFAELPFILDLKKLADVADRAKETSTVLGVSCTIRYYPPFRLIHDLLLQKRIGRLLYFEYSLGNHLEDWHPYEDYRKFYASDAKLGGAGLDMILHEIAAIHWWLGDIESAYGRLSKVSSLEISGPDTHDALLTFASGCRGYFHHDIIERGTLGRHLRIVGEDGTIEWHQNLPAIRVYEQGAARAVEATFDQASDWEAAVAASREVTGILAKQRSQSGQIPLTEAPRFTYESCYLREMHHFMEACRGEHPYTQATLEQELHTVRTFHAIVGSSEQQRELNVREVS